MQPERPEHEPDPELERALGAWKPEPARAAFRSQLRELFIEAGSASVEETVAPELAGALDAYAPQASAGFRDRLRAEFVSGSISAPVSAPRVAQADRGRWRLLVGGAGGLLAAAAALVLWILPPAVPAWSVDPARFVAAGLSIDGRALPEDTQPIELARLLSRAKEFSTADHPVRLMLGDLFVVEVAESSTIDLSLMPKDLSRVLVLRGVEGGFHVATGSEFKRAERGLRFETDDVDVQVVGTVFGVDLYPSFTCVCCLEGEVIYRNTPTSTSGTVEGGNTHIVYKSGEPDKETSFEPHMVRLQAFVDSL